MSHAATSHDATPASPRTTWLVCAVVILFATAVRCLDLGKSLWSDEADSLIHSRAGDFIASARLNVHPPLYFWLLRQFEFVTPSFGALRLFSVACGVATVALFFRAVPAPAALLAGILAACAPEMVYQSQELRHYGLLNLLLLLALLCTLRLAKAADSRLAQWGLGGSLAAAAMTHLATGFFMVPLALTLAWSHRRAPLAQLFRLGALFVPAAVLLVFFSKFFLGAANQLGYSNWWMAPANWPALRSGLSVAVGWDQVQWLAAAVGRHVPGGEFTLLAAATVSVGFALWTAWVPPSTGLALTLLAIALGYWAVTIVYSIRGLSVLMPRILIPGVMPLFLSIAAGVAAHPVVWRRRLAGVAIGLYAMTSIAPWLWHFARVPREDLRGLVENVRSQCQHEEVTIFVGGTDVALDVYWPEFKNRARTLTFSLLDPLPPQIEKLRRALARRAAPGDVLVAYREDGYFYQREAVFAALLDFLRREGHAAPVQVWAYNFQYLLRLPSDRSPPPRSTP